MWVIVPPIVGYGLFFLAGVFLIRAVIRLVDRPRGVRVRPRKPFELSGAAQARREAACSALFGRDDAADLLAAQLDQLRPFDPRSPEGRARAARLREAARGELADELARKVLAAYGRLDLADLEGMAELRLRSPDLSARLAQLDGEVRRAVDEAAQRAIQAERGRRTA